MGRVSSVAFQAKLKKSKKFATKRSVRRQILSAHEVKFKENGDASGLELAIDSSTGFIATQLSDPDQGLTDLNRVGDVISLVSLKFGGMVISRHTEPVPYRIVIVQWYGEATPTAIEIFSPTGSTLNAADVTGPNFNQDHRKFYKILYHKRGIVGTTADTGPPAEFQLVQSKRITKFGRKKIYYRAGTVVGQNNVWLFGISNQTNASDDGPLLQFDCLLHYTG